MSQIIRAVLSFAILGITSATGLFGLNGFYGFGYNGGGGVLGGLGLPYGGGGIAPGFGAQGAIVPAAILSQHNVHFVDVHNEGQYIPPTTVDVPANIMPVNFIFRSASSLINVAHVHEGAKGSFKETVSQDEPHIIYHLVTKPIIQEIKEIISPFRKIVQEVEPVKEEIKTFVARGIPHNYLLGLNGEGNSGIVGNVGGGAYAQPAIYKNDLNYKQAMF